MHRTAHLVRDDEVERSQVRLAEFETLLVLAHLVAPQRFSDQCWHWHAAASAALRSAKGQALTFGSLAIEVDALCDDEDATGAEGALAT